jgi:hypothetical protein
MSMHLKPGWFSRWGLVGFGLCVMPAGAGTGAFGAAKAGSPPDGWSCGSTGGGSPRWTMEVDTLAAGSPPVLKQSGSGRYPWCVKADTALTNGWVEVRFKALAGKEDQAGGVVWRWKDGDNYYVARANALENNVSLYYTKDGSRHTIKYQNAPVPANQWHLLRVDFHGETIRVSLNGKVYIEEQNQRISGAGKVGVWTKADSVTLFDGFAYEASKS